MPKSPFARLAGLALAALLIVGCAGAPSTARPAPQATTPPLATAAPSAQAAYPAAPEAAYPAAPAAAYPTVPDGAQLPVGAAPQNKQATPIQGYRVVNSYPHDRLAYTQGLVYVGNDTFYEGTGLYSASSLREVALNGEVRRHLPVPDVFGEGVAVVGERIFQLTWQNCVGYIYNRADFQRVGQFSMPYDIRREACLEGWGLTYDGTRLILSDGSDQLFFVDPAATERTGQLAITGQVTVYDSAGSVSRLNELEYIRGEVFANIYTSTQIARINPATGQVTAYIELGGLFSQLSTVPYLPPPEVLNGIAYDEAGDRLFVTGKRWPLLFEIDVVVGNAWTVYLPMAEAG